MYLSIEKQIKLCLSFCHEFEEKSIFCRHQQKHYLCEDLMGREIQYALSKQLLIFI